MANVTAPQFQQDVNNAADWANGDENTTVTMRLGQQADSPAKVIKRVDDLAAAQREDIYENATPYTVGNFTDGFTYTALNQRGEFGGDQYVFLGGLDGLPHVVAPATDPTLSPTLYAKANYNDAASVANANGGNVQNQLDIKDGLTVNEAVNYSGIASLVGSRVWLTDRGAWFDVVLSSSLSSSDVGVIESLVNPDYSFHLIIKGKQVSLRKFGFVDGDNINWTDTINSIFDYYTTRGGITVVVAGKVLAAGVVVKDYCYLDGVDVYGSKMTAPDLWDETSVIETRDFDTYKWLTTGIGGEPTDCGIKNITIDGNADNFGGTPSATSGLGLRFAAKRAILEKVRVDDAPGIGIHSALLATKRVGTLWFKESTKLGYIKDIKVFGARNDGWVFEGPSDSILENIEVGVCGWPDTTYTASRPSLYDPGRRVANFVASAALEIGWLHSFGCREGHAFLIARSPNLPSGTVRVKWDTLICESSNSGFIAFDGARYQGSVLDVHNCYGANAEAYLRDYSTLLSSVDNVEIVCDAANDNGQRKVILSGSNTNIGNLKITGANTNGAGLVFDGYSNKVSDATIRDLIGTGISVVSTCQEYSVKAYVDSCGVAANVVNGTSKPVGVDITAGYGNTSTFTGFENYPTRDRSRLNLKTQAGATDEGTTWSGVSPDIDNSVVGLQTINIPINGVYKPNEDEINLNVNYVSGNMRSILRMFIVHTNCTKSVIQCQIEFENTGGAGVCRISATKA